MSYKCVNCKLVLIGRVKPKKCPECGATIFTRKIKMKESMKTFLGALSERASKSRN